jgi:hypothetical protein
MFSPNNNFVYLIHETGAISGTRVTMFANNTGMCLYEQSRECHLFATNNANFYLRSDKIANFCRNDKNADFQIKMVRTGIYTVFEKLPTESQNIDVFICRMSDPHVSPRLYLFFSQARMNKVLENNKASYTQHYNVAYIVSQTDAANYAKMINNLEEWYVKLGTLERCLKYHITETDLKSIGFHFDPKLETIEQFIEQMKPLAEIMFNLSKKQVAQLHPNGLKLADWYE